MASESFDEECRTMVDDCLGKLRIGKLTAWELGFLKGMQAKLGSSRPSLSTAQYSCLERIWERVTKDG